MALRRHLIAISVILLLTFPSMRIATVSHAGFAVPIQNYLLQQEQYTNDGKSQKSVYLSAKSSQDIISVPTGIELASPHPPGVSNHLSHIPEPLLQAALREIFIPPEDCA